MRQKRSRGAAAFLLSVLAASPPSSAEVLAPAKALGPSAPGLLRPVANGLHFEARDGASIITGETGPTAEYQLLSEPITLAPETRGFVLRLEGEVLRGGMYCGLLNESGRFIEPPRNLGAGGISVEELVVRSHVKRVRIVLGNIGDGVQSLWVIRRCELVQLGSERLFAELPAWARRERFQGSAWVWALQVLSGRRSGPK